MQKQIELAEKFLAAKDELNKKRFPLSLDIQFFAKKENDDSGDDDDSDDEGDNDSDDDSDDEAEPSLAELMKSNPAIKKEFQALFKERFDKRLKGVDLEKARQLLKEQAEKQDNADDEEKKSTQKADEISEKEKKLIDKTKRIAVKEYAIDKDLNPKLVARLIDISKLSLDDDGEVDPDELEEVIDDLTDEFPELFRKSDKKDDEADSKDDEADRKKSPVRTGRKKTNSKANTDLAELGKQKALERAKRKGLIK